MLCLLAIVIWSSLEITGKLVGVGIDPFTVTAWRFVIGGLILLPFAINKVRTSKQSIRLSSILHTGSLGILNVCVSMLLLQLSIYYGKASLSAVIISMNPLFVSLFAAIIIHEKLSTRQVISTVMGLLGLLFIIFQEHDFSNPAYANVRIGIIFAILAALSFGLWTVLTKSAVYQYGNTLTNALSFLFGGVCLLVINWVVGKQFIFNLTTRNILLMSYLGIVITGVAYLLYFQGMKLMKAGTASTYFFLKPALAYLLAYLFLGETLGWGQLVGVALIVCGIIVLNTRKVLLPQAIKASS
mgnify:CR=1 FL=1